MSAFDWELRCSGCTATAAAEGLPTVCDACGEPWLVMYPGRANPRPLRDVVVYPAGGGTGLIAMWLAFRNLLALEVGG